MTRTTSFQSEIRFFVVLLRQRCSLLFRLSLCQSVCSSSNLSLEIGHPNRSGIDGWHRTTPRAQCVVLTDHKSRKKYLNATMSSAMSFISKASSTYRIYILYIEHTYYEVAFPCIVCSLLNIQDTSTCTLFESSSYSPFTLLDNHQNHN